MKLLASRIFEGLQRADHHAVYEADLSRFWPLSDANREEKIAAFAQGNGLRLRFYKPGLCAIFDRNGNGAQTKNGDGESSAVDSLSTEEEA